MLVEPVELHRRPRRARFVRTQAKAGFIRLTDFTAPSAITLDGAGANSIAPFFEKVFYDYEQHHSKITINYSPAGSSVGIKDIQQNTVDFGDSEIPMSASALAAARGARSCRCPWSSAAWRSATTCPACAERPAASTGPRSPRSSTAAITNWDAPQIAKVSGVSNLPNLAIVPVHRADSSGPGLGSRPVPHRHLAHLGHQDRHVEAVHVVAACRT